MKPIEVFEIVEKHMLTQNKKSFINDDEDTCGYRSGSGLKCAIGCLIKDEFYDPKIETKSVDHYEVFEILQKSLGFDIDPDLLKMLYHLQLIYDGSPVESWPTELAELRETVEDGLYGD